MDRTLDGQGFGETRLWRNREDEIVAERPAFEDIKDYDEFCKYYWYREELIRICKGLGLKSDGSKIELNSVIRAYFAGEKIPPVKKARGRSCAGAQGGSRGKKACVSELSLDTGLIACGFTFGNRFREFYAEQTGVKPFKFNVDMVATAKAVKENGDEDFTLRDLLDIYYGKKTYATYDKSALQWNKFVKDFCADEATAIFHKQLKAAAILWKIVRESDRKKEYSHALFEEYADMMKNAEYAGNCGANRVYPMSIAQGLQDGEIIPGAEQIPDGEKIPGAEKIPDVEIIPDGDAVLFWHYAGFAYISGNLDEEFLNKIYREYFQKEPERRFVLVTDDPNVEDFFADKECVRLEKRAEYRFGSLLDVRPECEYRIEQISETNYDRIHGKIVPDFSWASREQFLKNGFGFVALDGEKVIAVAFSAAVSSDEVDIGIETDESYRHQGLAKVLADRMCREIMKQGKQPVWAHSVSNEGSKRTAESVGFIQERVNTVILRK